MSRTTKWKEVTGTPAAYHGLDLPDNGTRKSKHKNEDVLLEKWAQDNINHNHLLNPEELAIWEDVKLDQPRSDQSNIGKKAIDVPDDEASLLSAIETLQNSTRSLNAQADRLEQQQSLLRDFQHRNGSENDHAIKFEHAFTTKQANEAQRLRFLNDELFSKINSQLDQMQDKLDLSTKIAPSLIAEQLKMDDRSLASLDVLCDSTAETRLADIASQQKYTNDLLATLEHLKSQSLKEHLDQTYLSHIKNTGVNSEVVNTNEVRQVEADLQLLYTEIETVTKMLVHHEHGARLQGLLQDLHSTQQHEHAENMSQAREVLESMSGSLQTLSQQLELLSSHRAVFQELRAHVKLVENDQQRYSEWDEKLSNSHDSSHLTTLLKNLDIEVSKAGEVHDLTSQISSHLASLGRRLDQRIQDYMITVKRTAISGQQDLQSFTSATSTDFAKEKSQIDELEQSVTTSKAQVERVAVESEQASTARRKFVRSVNRESR